MIMRASIPYNMCSFLLLITSFAAQASDTIYVNDIKNSYLVFDNPVDIVNLGTSGDYVAEIEKNVVFVKALHKANETTIFVSAGPKVIANIICFKKNNHRFLYDYRDKTLNVAASYSRDNYVPEVDISLIRERLYSLQDAKREVFDIGINWNKINWSLSNIKTDNSAIYLKLRLENNSALIYRVESISVENAEFYKKRFLSRKKVNKIPVVPLIEGNIADVKPYGQHDFYLAIPVYAVGDQGEILVTIRESTGVRSLQLAIPPKLMNKTDLF